MLEWIPAIDFASLRVSTNTARRAGCLGGRNAAASTWRHVSICDRIKSLEKFSDDVVAFLLDLKIVALAL